MNDGEIYCPVCGGILVAENADRVDSGLDESYVFVHDEIAHSEEDIKALSSGIN